MIDVKIMKRFQAVMYMILIMRIIAICNSDGTEETIVTFVGNNEWVPTWVDMTHLLFSREQGRTASIIFIDIENGNEEILVSDGAQNWRPSDFPF